MKSPCLPVKSHEITHFSWFKSPSPSDVDQPELTLGASMGMSSQGMLFGAWLDELSKLGVNQFS